jgi:hypothetical protein
MFANVDYHYPFVDCFFLYLYNCRIITQSIYGHIEKMGPGTIRSPARIEGTPSFYRDAINGHREKTKKTNTAICSMTLVARLYANIASENVWKQYHRLLVFFLGFCRGSTTT